MYCRQIHAVRQCANYTTVLEVCKLSLPIYLAFSPEEADRAAASGQHLACLGYQLAPDTPALLAPDPLPAENTFLILQDDVQPPYPATPALARLIVQYAAAFHTGLLCDCDRPVHPFWTELIRLLDAQCRQFQFPLWVPEAYASAAPEAGVIVRSDLTKGDFIHHISRAAAAYPGRCVLELRPVSARFSPPCLPDSGEVLTPGERQAQCREFGTPVFYSDALFCMYCNAVRQNSLQTLLFDTRSTMQKKLEAAETAGFQAAVGLLQELATRLPADEAGGR